MSVPENTEGFCTTAVKAPKEYASQAPALARDIETSARCAGRQGNVTHALLRAARRWWSGKRPRSYTLTRHLKNPTVNTTTQREAVLAMAVAATYRKKGPSEVPFAPLTEYERACEDALRPEVPVSVIPDGTMTKAERMAERERLSPTPRLPEDEVQAPVEVCPHKTLTNDAVGMGGVWRCDDCGAVASFRSRP
jgi:hypothetical protein